MEVTGGLFDYQIGGGQTYRQTDLEKRCWIPRWESNTRPWLARQGLYKATGALLTETKPGTPCILESISSSLRQTNNIPQTIHT